MSEKTRNLLSQTLGLIAFIMNFLLLTQSIDTWTLFFGLKLGFFFFLFVLELYSRGKTMGILLAVSQLLIFLNVEVPIYLQNQTLCWVVFFRVSGLWLRINQTLRLKKESIFLLVLLSIILVGVTINYLEVLGIPKSLEVIPIFLEGLALLSLISGFTTQSNDFEGAYFKSLNFLHEGIIVLRKEGESYKVEICNEKAKNLLENPIKRRTTGLENLINLQKLEDKSPMKIFGEALNMNKINSGQTPSTQEPNNLTSEARMSKSSSNEYKSGFSQLNHSFFGFNFVKIKSYTKDQTIVNLDPVHNSPDITQKKFTNLNEILNFHTANTIGKDSSLFERLPKENLEWKLSHNLNLTVHSEITPDKKEFYFVNIRKLDNILNLKEKNDIKTRLLSSFSHELKTPLNGSIPMLEALKSSPKLDETLRGPFVDNPLGSLKLLDNTLSNILDYSLIISDQFMVNLCQINLKRLLTEVLSILKPQIKMKELELYLEIDDKVLKEHFFSDYNRLKQILLNILINAIHFTNKGEITLKIQLISSHPFAVEFTIEDTGIGMPSEKLTALQEKLKFALENIQVNSTGSCLGLTISNHLAMILGKQNLEVSSLENVGSIFRFVIIDQSPKEELPSSQTNSFSPKNTVNIKRFDALQKTKEKNRNIIEFSKKIEARRRQNLTSFKGFSTTNLLSLEEFEEASRDFRRMCELEISQSDLNEKLKAYDFDCMIEYSRKIPVINRSKLENIEKTEGNFQGEKEIEFFNPIKMASGKDLLPDFTSHNQMKSLKNLIFPLEKLTEDSKIAVEYPKLMKNKSSQIMKLPSGLIPSLLRPSKFAEKIHQNHQCEEILLVDDDAFNLLSLETLFQMFNYRCKKANNGEEAVEALKAGRKCEKCLGFRLILMDYQMPVMDGVQSTREIMNLVRKGALTEVPVIGCTAFITKKEIEDCFDAGMKDVIFKPLNKGVISNLVRQWL